MSKCKLEELLFFLLVYFWGALLFDDGGGGVEKKTTRGGFGIGRRLTLCGYLKSFKSRNPTKLKVLFFYKFSLLSFVFFARISFLV